MRLVHEILHLRSQPVIAAGSAVMIAHSLLNDCPLAFRGHEKAVMINAEAVLNRCRVDFRSHAAVVGEPQAVEAKAFAIINELDGGASRGFSFSSCHEDTELAPSAPQSDL